MQALTKKFLANCFYPSPFGVVPQLNLTLFQIPLKDLSVALLYSLFFFLCSVFKVQSRRRKVRSTPFPPCGENFVRSLAPPFQIKPASLGFDLSKRNDVLFLTFEVRNKLLIP